MDRKEIILPRLGKLEDYVRLLERLREYPKDSILKDPFVYDNLQRYLQLAIQTVLDISNHILAERKVRGISEYRDLLERLGSEGVISVELAARIIPMAGLRNILVHQYLDLDREKLYEILQQSLEDFREFARQEAKQL